MKTESMFAVYASKGDIEILCQDLWWANALSPRFPKAGFVLKSLMRV